MVFELGSRQVAAAPRALDEWMDWCMDWKHFAGIIFARSTSAEIESRSRLRLSPAMLARLYPFAITSDGRSPITGTGSAIEAKGRSDRGPANQRKRRFIASACCQAIFPDHRRSPDRSTMSLANPFAIVYKSPLFKAAGRYGRRRCLQI